MLSNIYAKLGLLFHFFYLLKAEVKAILDKSYA